MPRGRKRSAGATTTSVSSGHYIAPGGGTTSDMAHLSHTLNLSVDAIAAIMNCGGQGVVGVGAGSRSSRRSAGGDVGGEVGGEAGGGAGGEIEG